MHGPDVEGSSGIALKDDEIALGGPVGVGRFLQRHGDLSGCSAAKGDGVDEALDVGEDGLVVGGDGHLHVRALRDNDLLFGGLCKGGCGEDRKGCGTDGGFGQVQRHGLSGGRSSEEEDRVRLDAVPCFERRSEGEATDELEGSGLVLEGCARGCGGGSVGRWR